MPKLDFEQLPQYVKKMYISIGLAAIEAAREEMTKEMFIEFCKGVWETMEINGMENFEASTIHLSVMQASQFLKTHSD